MNISMNMLSDHLTHFSINCYYAQDSTKLVLSGAALFSHNSFYKEELVYLASMADLQYIYQITQPISLILIGKTQEPLQQSQIPLSVNLIHIDQKVSFHTVFNQVVDIFQELYRWGEKLHNLVLNHAPIEEMLKISASIICNPLVVFDRNFCLLYQSDHAASLLTYEIDKWSGKRMLPLDFINELKISLQYRRGITGSRPFILPDDHIDFSCIFADIQQGYQKNCILALFERNRPLREGDCQYVEILASYISISLKQRSIIRTGHSKEFEQFLLWMLNGIVMEKLEIQKYLNYMKWKSDQDYTCIRIKTNEWDWNSPFITGLCNQIEASIEDSFSLLFDTDIVVIINLTKTRLDIQGVSNKLVYFLREGLFHAGISYRYWDFATTLIYYQQAGGALEMGERYDKTKWCYLFETYAFQYLTTYGTTVIPVRHVCAPDLVKLFRYDQTHDTEFLLTL